MNKIAVAGARCLTALLAFTAVAVWTCPAVDAAVSPAPVENPGLRWLVVRTTPSLPNVQFVFAGSPMTTDATGETRMLITQAQLDAFRANREALLQPAAPTFAVGPGVRARFAGWGKSTYNYSATDKTGDIENASFDLEYLTTFSFTDHRGRSLPASKIQSVQLRSSTGGTIDVEPDASAWLQGSRSVANADGFDARDTYYKITKVMSDGSNVVHEAQQRFYPSRTQAPVVELLFFSVTFGAHDALFGRRIGSGIDLEYPDGHVRHVGFHRGHTARMTDLPRGRYRVTVKHAGFLGSRPIRLSRNQVVDIQVVSYLDVFIFALLFGEIAALVLIVGHRRRARAATEAPSSVAVERELVPQETDPGVLVASGREQAT